MNGHAGGERLSWLLAAALVAIGGSGFVTPPISTLTPHSGSVEAASVAGPTSSATSTAMASVSDRYLGQVAGHAVLGPAAALVADQMKWPSVAPVVTTATSAPAPTTRHVAPTTSTAVWWSVYHGTNHVWMPTLGVNKAVYTYACSRTADPANYVYRWGCAGTNNVYLLGHAWGVFKPLHDAYYNGKLRVGMPVIYADSQGHVRLYRVTTWRVVTPTQVSWAVAAQSRPSMTLQTCLGATSAYRLLVRLVVVTT